MSLQLDDYSYEAPLRIVNPVFVIKDWGDSGVVVKVDGKQLERGEDYRVGYEETHTGIDIILWVKIKSTEEVRFSLIPTED